MDESETLRALLAGMGVGAHLVAPLARYGELLLEANRRFNLTGADTPEELAPHLFDSLTAAAFVEDPLVDIGSGGGLPAIPLAIVTGVRVTLIEATSKKAAFLEAVLDKLDLEGTVIPQRAELAGRDPTLRERFASATARGVSSAPAVLELALPFLRQGGRAVLQRGRMDARERDALIDAARMLGGEFAEDVPAGGERRIILVQKMGPTPARFPRRPGVPEKRPLCFS